MRKKRFGKILPWISCFCMLSATFLRFVPPSEAEGSVFPYDLLTATAIRVVASPEGTFYQENANRYVVGPDGWIDFHITIKEKYRYGMGQGDGQENETHVYRYTPDKPGYLDIDEFLNRKLYGTAFKKKDLKGNEVTYSASGVDLTRLGNLPKIYYRDELPKVVTVYPDHYDIYENDVSKGVNVDKFVICINEDPVMFSSDFEIKYRFQAGDYFEETDWTVCNDMNYISIPGDQRNNYMHLFLEIRDKLGLYYPYTFSWGAKGTKLMNRITMSSDKVIQGGDFFHMYLEQTDQGFKNMLYTSLRNGFLAEESYHEVPRLRYGETQPIAVFLNIHPNLAISGYTCTRMDIDIQNCGYQWSKNPLGPDPDRPFIPFDHYYPATELHSYYNIPVEGYWCEVTDRGYDLTEDGTYYLHIRACDAVTRGVDWFPVIYDGNKYTWAVGNYNVPMERHVKLIKDLTPLEISISEPQFTSADYDINIQVTDNYGLLAAQYHVCNNPLCTPDQKVCSEQWVDIALSDDKKLAEAAVNTANIFSSLNEEKFTVHVRAVEARHITPDPDPFAYPQFISVKSMEYYVPRTITSPVLKMGYFGEVAGPGQLAPAKEYDFYFYGYPEGGIFPGTDYYYEDRNAIGDIYYKLIPTGAEGATEPDWAALNGHRLRLSGDELNISGEYVLKAYVEDPWNDLRSEICEYKLNFTDAAGGGPVITATPTTWLPTNEDVSVKLESDTPVSVSVINEAGTTVYESVYGQNHTEHTFVIAENGRYCVEYETNGGITGKKDLFIGNIDKCFSTSFFERVGKIMYLPQEATRGNVTAYLFVGEKTLPIDDGITWQNGWISYTFTDNGSHEFYAEDLAGNKIPDFADIYDSGWNITARVDWIDRSIPDYTLTYSETGPTNEPVTATLDFPGGTIINNGGSNTYVFYNNGSFTFKVRDQKGLLHDIAATVTGIDKTPPQITLYGQLVYPLYQGLDFDFEEPGYSATDNIEGDITGRVRVTNNVNVYEGGYYEISYTVTDEAGNTATEVRSVPVYKLSNINLLINGMGIRGGAQLDLGHGVLNFEIAGLKSENFVLKYLPGKHKPGVFKDQGIVINNKRLAITEKGWHTFYVMDEEMTMFCGQAYFK